MAELASGAVSSLLGVIRNEWQLLGRVGGDVQFIREEMESMNSFLMHLARTVPPGGEHDEQVRTWMNQVRLLAQDCNNCIDLYLYRGNRDIHLGKDRIRCFLRWVPWFLQKLVAQHRAALELRELKERARDVGKRRLRYGVEVPKKAAPAPGAPGADGAEGGEAFVHLDGEGDDGRLQVVGTMAAAATDVSGRIRRALFGVYVPEDYFNDKLAEWIEGVGRHWAEPQQQRSTRCVAVVVPSTDDSGAIVLEASAVAKKHVDNTFLVDIPALHYWFALGPKNVLYYILREIELRRLAKSNSQSQQQQEQGQGTVLGEEDDDWHRKKHIRQEKRQVIREIKKNIETMKLDDKIQEIKTQIEKVKDKQLHPYLEQMKKHDDKMQEASLGVLLVRLHWSVAAAEDESKKKAMPTLAESYDTIIDTTAKKLKDHMEQVEGGGRHHIRLDVGQYAHILRKVFPNDSSDRKAQEKDSNKATNSEGTPSKDQIKEIIDKVKQDILSDVIMAISNNKGQQDTKTNSTSHMLMNEDQVKKMIDEAKLEILQQPKQEDKSDKKQEGVPGGQSSTPTVAALSEETEKKQAQLDITGSNTANKDQIHEANVEEATMEKNTETLDAIIKETIMKVKYYIQRRIQRQLVINGIVDKIRNHLNSEKTLIILKVDQKYMSQLWGQTINALSLLPYVAVVMILTKTDDIQKRAKEKYCYPQGDPIDYSYHDIVLEITSQQKNEDNYDPQIFRAILDKCEPNEFCMKIFAHTLYAKPKRSKEELHMVHNALESLPPKSFRSIAMKMLKFSYGDLPKEYKSCLLYLAIFPRGHKIRRSTLIGRWVVEGLITTEDWRWSTSVHKAEQCFDTLITKWLIYSAEISATERVKSCTVGDLVHEFITEIAKKQRIVETRLSHHLARRFSIFNDLHLRGSDKIFTFLQRLSESSRWSRLKVLDLERCQCFKKNRSYLKNICNNILLLKYLSLRETDVNWLPSEINNLRELEVLDIQQTEVPESATEHLLLLKLKRLLAGHTNPGPSSTNKTDTSFHSHVVVPDKIEKMLDMEVLSNVKAQSSQNLEDIGRLWQLRKLGVVIQDKASHYKKLLEAISNLHECLRSLSITLDTTNNSPKDLNMTIEQKHSSPKVLESLDISGIIVQKQLIEFMIKDGAPLTKVTLSKTSLSEINLEALSMLPMLRCLRLRYNTYTNNKLTFKKDEFKELKYLLIETSNRIEISFEETTTSNLEKIVLSFNNIDSIAIDGVDQLSKLEELELNNNKKPNNSGGITTPFPPAVAAPFTTATVSDPAAIVPAPDPAPFAIAATNHDLFNPAAFATTNPSAFSPATTATAVTNDPIPPTATTTDPIQSDPPTTGTTDATIPSPSASAAAVANGPIPSNTTATNPTPSTPIGTATATIPTPSDPTISTNNNTLFSKLLSDAKKIAKLTLRGTMLKQYDLRLLARMANIRCLELLHGSYDESELSFSKNEFLKLNILIVDCSTITGLTFDTGSCPKLKKIIWTFTEMNSFSGIENLPRLNELEFTGNILPNKVKYVINENKDRIYYTHYKPESQDQIVENTKDKDYVPSCPFIWKDKGWRRRK